MSAAPTNPYRALVAAGCEIDNHESDLYVKATPDAVAIVQASGWTFTRFVSAIDGSAWLDVSFAYLPWWEARTARGVAKGGAS